jgi:hypothetical protein
MSEWWTYSPRDLLLFSPQTYYRLFELHNQAWWPLPLLALALGVALPVLWRRGGVGAGRIVALILAAGWLWVAWAYHAQRYAGINLAADSYAWAFVVQAVLLVWLGAVRNRLTPAPATGWAARIGLVLVLCGVLGFPLLAPLLGRSWAHAEIFGMAPDPTVLATLGVLLLADARRVWILLPIPVLWCLLSGTTLWAMDAPEFALLPLAALLALVGAVMRGRR